MPEENDSPDSSSADAPPAAQWPEPAVGLLIFKPAEQKILLLKSQRWENQFRLPRGHVKLGESVEEALVRIGKEEAGLIVEPLEMIGFQQSIFSKEFAQPRHFLFFDFLVKSKGEAPGIEKPADEIVWLEPVRAADRTLSDSTRATLEFYLEKLRS